MVHRIEEAEQLGSEKIGVGSSPSGPKSRKEINWDKLVLTIFLTLINIR